GEIAGRHRGGKWPPTGSLDWPLSPRLGRSGGATRSGTRWPPTRRSSPARDPAKHGASQKDSAGGSSITSATVRQQPSLTEQLGEQPLLGMTYRDRAYRAG